MGRRLRLPTEPSGILGGVQGGYNWQSGQFVFGGEADIQITGADDTAAPFKFSNPWWGSLRGRGGVAWNSFLFYATAGLAFGEVEGQVGGLTENKTQLGWTAGLGTEVALNPRWSAKSSISTSISAIAISRSRAPAMASRPTCFALA